MTAIACRYETERLTVRPWHETDGGPRPDDELVAIVAGLLTARVAETLPGGWQGGSDGERARAWVRERDADASVSLATHRDDGAPVGLVILHASVAAASAGLALDIGYLIDERSWGRGFGRELVTGLVAWARAEPSIASLHAGTATDNVASKRILERAGFVPDDAGDDPALARYRIDVDRRDR